MPPKRKKQQPKNALYHFANTEVRRQIREEGRPAVSIQELIKIAHPRFQLLSEHEQNRWKEIAKEEKLKLRADTQNIFTSYGESVAEINQQRENAARTDKNMKDEIDKTVQNLQRQGTLLQEKIYLLDFNIFVEVQDPKQYIPAEICAVELTLEKGIESVFQTIIVQRSIPIGYMGEAREVSESTHRVPIRPSAPEPNYSGLLYRLQHFINSGQEKRENPPFYVMPESMNKCLSILRWMYERSYDRRRFPFKVYDLSYLLHTLRVHNPLGKHPGFLALCEDLLRQPHFDYAPNIECDWHRDLADEDEEVETMYCIQSKVTSKAYLFLDGCIGFYGIQPIANKHCPEAAKKKVYLPMPANPVIQQRNTRGRSKTSAYDTSSRNSKSEDYDTCSQSSSNWKYEDQCDNLYHQKAADVYDGNSEEESWGNAHSFSDMSKPASLSRDVREYKPSFQKKMLRGGLLECNARDDNDLFEDCSKSIAYSEHDSVSSESSRYYTASEYDTQSHCSSVYYMASQHETKPFRELSENHVLSRFHGSDRHRTRSSNSIFNSSIRSQENLSSVESPPRTQDSTLLGASDVKDLSVSSRLVDDVNGESRREKRVFQSKREPTTGENQEGYGLSAQNEAVASYNHFSSSFKSRPPECSNVSCENSAQHLDNHGEWNSGSVSSFVPNSVKEKPLGVKTVEAPMFSLGRGRGRRKNSADLEEQLRELKALTLRGRGRGRAKPGLGV